MKLMGRPNKKVTTRVTEDDQRTIEGQSLEKDTPQDPSPSKASEAEEQRLKELEEQVLRKQKELEECRARAREKSLKQRIEEAEASLRKLNEQLQNASHKVIHLDEPNSATKASQEKNSQKSFISIDTTSLLSINLQLA
jgi:t-SNARE complex subunit (syntaxin)